MLTPARVPSNGIARWRTKLRKPVPNFVPNGGLFEHVGAQMIRAEHPMNTGEYNPEHVPLSY